LVCFNGINSRAGHYPISVSEGEFASLLLPKCIESFAPGGDQQSTNQRRSKIKLFCPLFQEELQFVFRRTLVFRSILVEHYGFFNKDALSVRKLRAVFSDCGGIACGP
jgi:hypothetical protein